MINGFALKMLAIIAMIIDHIGVVFFPEIIWFRIIGRLSMPIFAFLCAEGYYHTHNKKKYILRLFVFALITEILYDLMLYGVPINFTQQNILFTLGMGVLSLYLFEHSKKSYASAYPGILGVLAHILGFEYSIFAVLTVVCFYNARYKSPAPKLITALGCVFAGGLFTMGIQYFAMLALIPILLYNGERGFKDKYHILYWVYPLQFLVLYFIRITI